VISLLFRRPLVASRCKRQLRIPDRLTCRQAQGARACRLGRGPRSAVVTMHLTDADHAITV
jgi:hypothetical protein